MDFRDSIIKLKDGRNLAYAECGDLNGKPLFYFHGWPGSRKFASEAAAVAKKLDVRVISIDRPGYGLSSYKENRALLDWPDDVVEIADKLKIKKFAIMGVSGGAPYAAACAYKIPHRLTKIGIVVGLAPTYIPNILDGTSFLLRIGWKNYSKIPFLPTFSAWLSYFQHKYLPWFNFLSFPAKEDQALMSNNFQEKLKESMKEAFRQGVKGPALDLKLYTTNWGFNLSDIKSKVYLWYGANDKNVSLAMGKYYASQISNSKLTTYPNEGHFCRINHEEEILKTLIN